MPEKKREVCAVRSVLELLALTISEEKDEPLPVLRGGSKMETRRKVVAYTLALPFLQFPAALLAQQPARYFKPPQTEWLPGSPKMKLLRDFSYRDPQGVMWTAKKGALVDGASIPRFAWTIAGSPYDPPYRDASIVHDYYCDTMERSWESTHLVFYEAMRTSGTSKLEADSKYWAVQRGGPRWDATHRWSGLWPVRKPRSTKGIPSPPPPPAEMAESWQEAEMRAYAAAEQEFQEVRARLASGRLSTADIPDLAEEQIARQPAAPF
jgi:hypothetical protein